MLKTTLEAASQAPRTYQELRRRIAETLVRGRTELESVKLDIYWHTGRLLAGYLDRTGAEIEETATVERLSRDLDVASSMLYRLLQFARAYREKPKGALTWSHIKELLTVPDGIKRKRLAAKVLGESWNVRRLRLQIQKERGPKRLHLRTNVPLEEPPRHLPRIRRVRVLEISGAASEPVVDLGFDLYEALAASAHRLKDRETVRWNPKASVWQPAGTKEELYYYHARIERVVDGDTLLTHILVHSRLLRRQYLRLRGLDAEPLSTAKGRRARDWLARVLGDTDEALVRTSLTDRYDRYIADVWAGGLYLNGALLQASLVERASY